jgi:hypothetical protein
VIDLDAAYLDLRAALAPLGIEVRREVVDLWRDREQRGHDAIPPDAARTLARVAARLAEACRA